MCLTEEAVYKWDKHTRKMTLWEIAKGLSLYQLQTDTQSTYKVANDFTEF